MGALENKKVQVHNLGVVPFEECWTMQAGLFEETIERKRLNKAEGKSIPTENFLLFVEHPNVFTLGKNGSEENLLIPLENLHTIGASYFPINRGGDITYHGPGQIVAYPILDLENFKPDLSIYLRNMEEVVIAVLKDYGIEAGRAEGLTGVWIEPESDENARKICAIGIKTSRWVTMHGLAFNVNTDLKYFDYIVPCGIDDKGVTSMEKELGEQVDLNEVRTKLGEKFELTFEMELVPFNVQSHQSISRNITG